MKTIKVPIQTERDNIFLEVVAEVSMSNNDENLYLVSIKSISLYFGIFPVSIEPSHLLEEAREEVIKAILIYVDEYFNED